MIVKAANHMDHQEAINEINYHRARKITEAKFTGGEIIGFIWELGCKRQESVL